MLYEVEITWRTIRQEGLGPLLKKVRAYFCQLFCGARFFLRGCRAERPTAAEELVDFSFNAAGGLLQLSQVRSESFR